MPIFEYKCQECGATFEKLVNTASQKVDCESCQSKKVEKQLSVFAATSATPDCPSASVCPSAGSCPSGGCCMSG